MIKIVPLYPASKSCIFQRKGFKEIDLKIHRFASRCCWMSLSQLIAVQVSARGASDLKRARHHKVWMGQSAIAAAGLQAAAPAGARLHLSLSRQD